MSMKKMSKEIKILLLLLVPILAVMLLHHLATGFTIYSDGIGYYSYVRSGVIDNDLHFLNEFQFYNASYSKFSNVARGAIFNYIETPKGYIDTSFLIGNSILWTPFFLTAHASSLALQFAGLPIVADGYGTLYELSIGIANLIYGFLAILIMYKFCRKWFTKRTAVLATVTVWYGTGLLWFHAVEPSMSHMNSLLLAGLFAYLWHNTLGKRTEKQWFLLGLILGLIYLVRQQDVLIVILPCLELARTVLKKIKFDVVKKITVDGAIFGAGAILALLLQLLIWKRMHGTYLVNSYANQTSQYYFSLPQLIPLLFSIESGMWKIPVMWLSIIGLLLFAHRIKGVAWYFVAVVFAQIIFTSTWSFWNSGFGLRFLLGLGVFFTLGAAELIERAKTRFSMKWIYAAVVILIGLNIISMILFLFKEVTLKIPLGEILMILIQRTL
jgi:hypothetical protein